MTRQLCREKKVAVVPASVIQRNLKKKDANNLDIQHTHCRKLPSRCKACVSKKEAVCLFDHFRAFKKGASGDPIYNPYFPSTSAPDTLQAVPCRVMIGSDRDQKKYILRTIRSAFVKLLEQDLALYDRYRATVRRRPPVLHMLHLCDFCAAAIFNIHWMCAVCGMDICPDCFHLQWDSDKKYRSISRCTYRRIHTKGHMIPVVKHTQEALSQLRNDAIAMKMDDPLLTNASIPLLCNEPAPCEHDTNIATIDSLSANNDNRMETTEDDKNDVLVLPYQQMSSTLFQQEWKKGKPVMIQQVDQKSQADWSPSYFINTYGNEKIDAIDCSTGIFEPSTVREYFEGFDDPSKRASYDPTSKTSKTLKIKDWPPKDDFKNQFPILYDDFMRMLPVPEYCTADGYCNLSNRLPDDFIRPDLGPKMFIAYGSVSGEKDVGTTNLHCDMSDAVNIMCYACQDDDQPAAVWDIFPYEALPKLQTFVQKLAVEQGFKNIGHPIHSQWIYLNDQLRQRLFEEYSVKSWRLYQNPGDAVFIPAGCAHQVSNYHSAIKCAYDFVSPENVNRCEDINHQVRQVKRQDVLQLKNTMLYAWVSVYKDYMDL
ncbi:uncharacterized protein BYT42DRAFT_562644 [Radiomyces spectabilis]|uniref:uncharacterized protein n=1 Tax=Radiomyces spectabilis TaxID=64574 RepID=UPI00221E5A93|nr:uncharacterized protein BYT42DRAFT_562644 [Radiomyces spectabilis]KAI8384472.1 hypothetical protein BYT42DRAFT_562644 [Radiomyces spectabilis]